MKKIDGILKKFAARHGVTLRKYAIQHNHLHLHVKVPSTRNYKRFIRAVTGAIAMAVGRMSRWTKKRFQFWDRRPFSRVVKGERARVRMDNYVRLNELEAWGIPRAAARVYLPFLPDN